MANNAKTVTLAANTVTPVDIHAWSHGVWVYNADTGSTAWVRLDGTDPAALGDDSFPVPPGSAVNFPTSNGVVTVRAISTGTPQLTVTGVVPAQVKPV